MITFIVVLLAAPAACWLSYLVIREDIEREDAGERERRRMERRHRDLPPLTNSRHPRRWE